jgi:hypothetical protein
LLGDIRSAFDAGPAERLPSDDLVAFLTGLEDHPWGEINKGKPLTKNGLAARLRPFRISPGTIWANGVSAKGYKREQFQDAFARYLSPTPSPENVRTSGPQDFCGAEADSKTSGANPSESETSGVSPSVSAAPDGLTVQKEGVEGDDDDAPWSATI